MPQHVSVEDRCPSLKEKWNQAIEAVCDCPVEMRDEHFVQVIRTHDLKQRRYHNVRHLEECFQALDMLAPAALSEDNGPEYKRQANIAALALFYHDIVYEQHADDNEKQSAETARQRLREMGVEGAMIDAVASAIEKTRDHANPATTADSLVLDADLAIFAAPSLRYREYMREIRQEHCWLPDEKFYHGRRDFLKAMLRRKYIYFTPYGRENWEALARENMENEMK